MLWKSRENVAISKWKDKKDVYTIRNAHTPERKQTAIRNVKVVIDYNAHMSGIDRSDQMFLYHSSLRKTVKRYKTVGIHVQNNPLINGHYMYLKYSGGTNLSKCNTFQSRYHHRASWRIEEKKSCAGVEVPHIDLT